MKRHGGVRHYITVVERWGHKMQRCHQTGKIAVIDRPKVRIQSTIFPRIAAVQVEGALRLHCEYRRLQPAGAKHDDRVRSKLCQSLDGTGTVHVGYNLGLDDFAELPADAAEPVLTFEALPHRLERMHGFERRLYALCFTEHARDGVTLGDFTHEVRMMRRFGGENCELQDDSRLSGQIFRAQDFSLRDGPFDRPAEDEIFAARLETAARTNPSQVLRLEHGAGGNVDTGGD